MKITSMSGGLLSSPWSAVIRWAAIAIVALVVCGSFFALHRHRLGEPRRSALFIVSEISRLLTSADIAKVLPLLELPPAAEARSPEEQVQWIADVLRNEVSDAGLEELRRHGQFGPLAEVFPEEAARWVDSAHLAVRDCVAFRMERDGIRAEVVLHQTSSGFRVLRCNNVKQMASTTPAKS